MERDGPMRPSIGDNLIEACTEIEAYPRGEAMPEWYEIDEALLRPDRPTGRRKKKIAPAGI